MNVTGKGFAGGAGQPLVLQNSSRMNRASPLLRQSVRCMAVETPPPMRSTDRERAPSISKGSKPLLADPLLLRDAEKEEYRKLERVESANFNWERWASHRSSSRYVRHLFTIFQSKTVYGLTNPLLSVAGVSSIVCM